MFHTTVLVLVLLSQAGCSSPGTATQPPAHAQPPRTIPVRGIFELPVVASARSPSRPELPPPPSIPPVPVDVVARSAASANPAGSACPDGLCAVPDPVPGVDPFADKPEGFAWPIGQLTPSGGGVSLRDLGSGEVIGRAWERDGRFRGIGLGYARTLQRTWRTTSEVGVAADGSEVVLALGIGRKL